MKFRSLFPFLTRAAAGTFAALPVAALAAQGLIPPAAESLWPQWQVRISLQTTAGTPMHLSGTIASGARPSRPQAAALLGDYYFARPCFGSFRASGGLLVGHSAGAPLFATSAAPWLGLSLMAGHGDTPPGAESPATLPYLGLGFSSAAIDEAFSLSADIGLVAGSSRSHAVLGSQGLEAGLRELRLSPVLQFGLRYTF